MDIIVPVHNGPLEVVAPCIDSVISSKSANGYDIHIIDDASTSAPILEYLARRAEDRSIIIHRNEKNLGFTRSVNKGMRINRDRDVILLNSDTLVFGDWALRLQNAANRNHRIATVNPMSNGWMSNYPDPSNNNNGIKSEVSDEEMDVICREANAGRIAKVYGTIGFCMFVARKALDELGLFDDINFPRGYGEETDFCYRSRALGWGHAIAGDVYVRHWENTSFGSEEKQRLIAQAFRVFLTLHPGHMRDREDFAMRDPVRPLREAIDLARVRRLLDGAHSLPCLEASDMGRIALVFDAAEGTARLAAPARPTLATLPRFRLPDDIAALNATLARLGLRSLVFGDAALRDRFAALLRGHPVELGLAATLDLAADSAHPGEAGQQAGGEGTRGG